MRKRELKSLVQQILNKEYEQELKKALDLIWEFNRSIERICNETSS